MEHRCNIRRPVSLDTVIESRPGDRIPGRIRNISLGGVFVELGARRPALNASVDLSVSVPLNGGSHPCRISAMVVQRTDRGVGVMFEDLAADTRAVLKTLIDARPGRHTYTLPVYAVRRAAAGGPPARAPAPPAPFRCHPGGFRAATPDVGDGGPVRGHNRRARPEDGYSRSLSCPSAGVSSSATG